MNRTKNETDYEAIDLAQIDNSYFVGKTSTVVIGISKDKKDKDLRRLHIVKSRDSGDVGKVLTYIVNFNLGQFTYVPETEEEINKNKKELEHRYDVAPESNSNGEDEF